MTKDLLSILTLTFLCWPAHALAGDEKIVFDLYPQTRPYIYSVGFKHEGVDRWYQIEVSGFGEEKMMKVISDVFYDSISKNFYIIHSGVVTIIPINRPYELRFHKRTE